MDKATLTVVLIEALCNATDDGEHIHDTIVNLTRNLTSDELSDVHASLSTGWRNADEATFGLIAWAQSYACTIHA